MKAKGDYQDLKPLQVYTRSIYWSVIWPSITSRYSQDALVLQRDFWGILKGSLFLEVKPNVSHGRCHRRSVASSKPTGGAAPSLERGGLPSRRTGGLPP